MLHGASLRFHVGSIACLADLENSPYADELCEILHYDPAKQRWAARLQHPMFKGKGILAKDSALQLVYCILPANAALEAVLNHVRVAEQQGAGGRGLAVLEACQVGEVLFEEHPFLLSAAGVEAAWQARWHAYLRLDLAAEADDAGARVAMAAFEQLSCGDGSPSRTARVREAAESVARASGYGEGAGGASLLEEAADRIAAVLSRVEANQFDFGHGSEVGASALYRQASLMNHSCRPTVSLRCRLGPLAPGSLAEGDGRVVVRAARALAPGEALCTNYGPEDLLSWPVARRRQHLLEEMGFLCRCQRCVGESGEHGRDAVDAPVPLLSSMD